MKYFLTLWLLVGSAPAAIGAPAKSCTCTCPVKQGDSYSTKSGKGTDREAAGESLKRSLGTKKCELTPTCKGGGCTLDD